MTRSNSILLLSLADSSLGYATYHDNEYLYGDRGVEWDWAGLR